MSASMSSYIPTAASTVTRAADNASMTGTNFSSWFSATQGTFVVEALSPSPSINGIVYEGALVGAAAGSSIGLDGTGTRVRPIQRHGAFRQEPGTTGSLVSNTTSFKAALAWGAVDSAIYDRGTKMTNAATPAQSDWGDSLRIGSRMGTSLFFNGYICSIRFYSTRLPDSTLQALTT